MGDYEQARTFYAESLGLRQRIGDPFTVAQSLEDLGVLASLQGQYGRAARLFGSVDAAVQRLGLRFPSAVPEAYWPAEAATRAALGEADFAAAWAEGRAMNLDEGVQYALDDTPAG